MSIDSLDVGTCTKLITNVRFCGRIDHFNQFSVPHHEHLNNTQ